MVEDGLTVTDDVVCDPLQTYVPPLVPRVTLLPAHIIPSLLVVPNDSVAEIVGVGSAFTVMVVEAVAEHRFTSVTVTV